MLTTCGVLAIASSGLALGQTTPPAPSTNSLLTQPIYPLSQVHAGLHGTAYTVFEGSTPEAMDVEILGVLHDAIGPGKDMVLARLIGAKPEYTGVVAGMSGSPVYIDGKLLGAIGFRIGQFTKQPIAGITPIQEMLQVVRQSNSNANIPPKELAGGVLPPNMDEESSNGSVHSPTWSSQSGDTLQPIETPLVFDGFSSASIDLFRQRFPSSDLMPVSGLGSASPDVPDAAPVVPGSAISAVIVSGDFNMAATCTVTYVDPKRLLACGHPITQFGNVSLPMTKAQVVATVASALDPIKIVNTTETVGAFTEDRESGILGVFGKRAQMIPVTLAIRGTPQPHIYHFGVVEHPRLTTGALTVSMFQAMQDTNGYNDLSTYRLRGEITVANQHSIKIDDMIAATDQKPASLATAIAVAQRFDSIFSNPREMPSIKNISLTLDAMQGRQSAALAEARVLNPTIHSGDKITVEATLHPYRQPQRLVTMTLQLPNTLTSGPVRLLVSDGTTLDHTLHLIPNPTAQPLGLSETIARLNELHPNNRLYVTLLAPVPQAVLQGHTLPAVPLTMANVLQPDGTTGGFTIDGETAIALGSKNMDLALSGSQVVTLDVKP
jgi:hypothetical protein